MARYIFQGTFRDGQGNVISDGTVSVCDAGTTTPSTLYAASTGGTSISSVTSDSNGFFSFYIDSSDYAENSQFDITLSKSGYSDKIYEDVVIYGKGADGVSVESVAWSGNDMVFTLDDASEVTLANAKIDLKGESGSMQLVDNLKLVVNAAVNKLDVFTKSGGAVPDATNFLTISIPDGSGRVARERKTAYLSGTSQIILADAGNYWSKGSLDGEIKTAWLYAIWDGTGIVWALGGYSGFTKVKTTTIVTDDDYLLLEAGSTYTRDAGHYCVAVAKIRYEYDTGDTPDHTIQSAGSDAPQVIWNPRSDYGYQKKLAATVSQGSNIAEDSYLSLIVVQRGKYEIDAKASGNSDGDVSAIHVTIRTGSGTYGSATLCDAGFNYSGAGNFSSATAKTTVYLNAEDTIHLGAAVFSASGTRYLSKDYTSIVFRRVD